MANSSSGTKAEKARCKGAREIGSAPLLVAGPAREEEFADLLEETYGLERLSEPTWAPRHPEGGMSCVAFYRVTPEAARKIVDEAGSPDPAPAKQERPLAPYQRPIHSKDRVRMTGIIDRGAWQSTPDLWRFICWMTPDGRPKLWVDEGQLRVHSLAHASRPIEMGIMVRVIDDPITWCAEPPADFMAFGQARPRNFGHLLKSMGVTHASKIGTLARSCATVEEVHRQTGIVTLPRDSNAYVRDFDLLMGWWNSSDPDLAREAVNFGNKAAFSQTKFTPGGLQAFYYLAHQYIGRDYVTEFFDELTTGLWTEPERIVDGKSRYSGPYLLRERTGQRKSRRENIPPLIQFNLLALALHLWLKNEYRTFLRWNPSEDPINLLPAWDWRASTDNTSGD